MADILIRGMEMPPKGKSICIEIFGAGGVHKFGNCYPCALAYEVKTPHGRLGDLDALEAKFREEALEHTCIGNLNRMTLGVGEFIDRIRMAPTIVPAEGGTNNG